MNDRENPRPVPATETEAWWLDCALDEACAAPGASRGLAERVLAAPHAARRRAALRAFATRRPRTGVLRTAAALALGIGTVLAVARSNTGGAAADASTAAQQDPEPRRAVLPANAEALAARIAAAPFLDVFPLVDGEGRATTPYGLPRTPASLGLTAASFENARGRFDAARTLLAWVDVRGTEGVVRGRLYASPEPHVELPTGQGPVVLVGAPAANLLTAAREIAASAPSAATVHVVRTTAEFVAALGSNRTIVIPEGTELRLQDAEPEDGGAVRLTGGPDQEATWRGFGYPVHAGNDHGTLTLTGLHDLRIVGDGANGASLVTNAFESRVLELRDCTNVALDNLSLGHAPQATCSGGVLALHGCRGFRASRLSLFGCGTEGIIARKTVDALLQGCTIHHCLGGALALEECRDWTMLGLRIHDVLAFFEGGAIWFADCRHVHVENGDFEAIELRGGPVLAGAESSTDVRIEARLIRCAGFVRPASGLLWVPLELPPDLFDERVRIGNRHLAGGRFDEATRTYLEACALEGARPEELRAAVEALDAAGAREQARALEAALRR